MRERQEPAVDGDKLTHPAFGQIGASRVQGGAILFGSDFEHHNYVIIRINRSELRRDLARDWVFPDKEMIEVAVSEAQWATFVSSMNMGTGTPCTITYVRGEGQMPSLPLRVQEEEYRSDFSAKAKKAGQVVGDAISSIEDTLGPSVSKKKKEGVLGILRDLEMELSSNMPFVAGSFDRHMEKTVERARIEVNAHISNAIQRAGLEALGSPVTLLPGPKEGS